MAKTKGTAASGTASTPAHTDPAPGVPAGAPPPAAGIPAALTPTAAYDSFLAEARAVPTTGLAVCRADLPVVYRNVSASLNAIAPRLAEIPALLPTLALDKVLSLANLVLALIYIDAKVTKATSTGAFAEQRALLETYRMAMLLFARCAALLNLVPGGLVAKIEAGRGVIDAARDVIALVGLLRDYATALAGKSPFDDAYLTQAEAVATWILGNATPANSAAASSAAVTDPNDPRVIRDQFWALILARFDDLETIAHALFKSKAATYVPPLQSHKGVAGTSSSAGATPAPTTPTAPVAIPVPAPAATTSPAALTSPAPAATTAPAAAAPASAKKSPAASAGATKKAVKK